MFNLIYTAYNYSVYYGETENIYFILTGDFSGTELTLAATFEYRGYYIFGENLTVSDYDKIFHTAALSNVRRGLFWYATNHLSALFYNDALNIKGSMGLNFYPYTLSLRGKISLSETAFIIEDGAFSYYYDVFNFDANTAIVLSGAITFSFDCVLSKIGAGLVWATPADSNENDTETYDELEAYYHGFVKTFQNPVVAEEITAKLSAVVNPFQIENHSETYFTFTNNFSAESVFTDVYGKPLQITATSGSKLCFEKRAEYLHNDGAKCCYYLGFAGVYRLSGGANFLCGLSGTEFIKQSATADDNFNIAFVGGQNSFVDQGGEFLDYTTCAYLQFTSNADYFCQSSDAPFFSSVPAVTFGNVETAEAGVLAYLPLKLVSLNDAPPVPVFPQNHTHVYDGIIPDFIPNSIYQKRFDLLAGKLLQQPRLFAESNAATMAITKNGLIVGLDSANIDYAVLAVNADNEQIRLANIDQTLRTALQDADAKVLFATPANFKQYTEAAACRFKLGSWLFDFSADNWRTATPGNDAPTLILLKYSADTNIREYMGGAPAFEVAYKKCFDSNNAPLPYFADFIEAVNSPTFSGMLILNYPASFEAPTPDPTPDITMIINGVKDKSEIFAHHLIIKAGKVEITGGGQVPHISSVGGVIDYNAEEQTHVAHTGTPPDYEFTTTRILSVFADNTQTAFTTRSELLINKLFETPATKSTGGGNSLLIDGILTKTDTNYFFVYKTNESGVYSLPTSLLEKVEINDVTLSTGSFTLGGGLFFPLPVSMPDLFGFGSDSSGDFPLPFTGLKINQTTGGGFAMSYGNLALAKAVSRANSFPAVFPCAPDALLCELVDNPAKLGLVPIATPVKAAALSAFSAPWFRLNYKIVMGDLGDLSGNVEFSLTLALCFCGNNFYAGVVPPPGIFGGGLLASGIMSVEAASVSLDYEEIENANLYTLKFGGIALKVLKFSFPQSGGTSIEIYSGGKEGKPSWKAEYKQ